MGERRDGGLDITALAGNISDAKHNLPGHGSGITSPHALSSSDTRSEWAILNDLRKTQARYSAPIIPNAKQNYVGIVLDVDNISNNSVRPNTKLAAMQSPSTDIKNLKYRVYCYIPGWHNNLGTVFPDLDSDMGEMYKSQLVYYETNEAKPDIKSLVWIEWNAHNSSNEAKFVENYDKDQKKISSTGGKQASVKELAAESILPGTPITTDPKFGEPDVFETEILAGSTFRKKQPESWLQSCAQENGWANNLVETKFAPPSKYYSNRVFDTDMAQLDASTENLFAIVYHDGSPSIPQYWEACVSRNDNTATHYYIDHNNSVHEFVGSTLKTNHAQAKNCPGNNDLSIGVNCSSFATTYRDIYVDYNSGVKLKDAYRNLFKNKYLPLGSPLFLGMPTPTGKIFNNPFYDMQIFPSNNALEVGYQLTSCLANKYNIPSDGDIPLIRFIKDEKKLGKIANTAFNKNNVPYFYNPDDLRSVVPSFSRNTLCGISGLSKYAGIIAETWFSETRRQGGTIQEFYSWLRISGANKTDSFYMTLGSLLVPGVSQGASVVGNLFVDVSSYASKFGNFYLNVAAVPNPVASAEAENYLKSIGKKYYATANFYRELILHRDQIVLDSAGADLSSFILAAPIGSVEEDIAVWDDISGELKAYLYTETDCLAIYEKLRKKMFETQMKINGELVESDYQDYETDFGLFLTKTSLQFMHYLSKKLGKDKPVGLCFDNAAFFDEFLGKYKVDIKSVIKT
tara:strand:+ start:441 stop:2666 length:2226 start_codon:yes stop_codon:yes gene_type:complete